MNDSAAVDERLSSVDATSKGFRWLDISLRRIATAVFVAQNLNKPILVEGSAGVGKTELALSTASGWVCR